MATKDKAILYAKDAAQKKNKPYAIYKSRNGQYLYAPADSEATHKAIANKKAVNFFYPVVATLPKSTTKQS